MNAARVGRFFGFALIALGVLQVVTGSGLNGIWLALIGWFVVSAATAEEQQASRRSDCRSHSGSAHGARPTVLDGNLTVADFVARLALTQPFSTYPLVDPEGRLTGLVTLNRAGGAGRASRDHPPARDRLLAEVPIARPEDPLVELLERSCRPPTVALLSSMTPAESWAWCPAATSHVRWSWLTYAASIPTPHTPAPI